MFFLFRIETSLDTPSNQKYHDKKLQQISPPILYRDKTINATTVTRHPHSPNRNTITMNVMPMQMQIAPKSTQMHLSGYPQKISKTLSTSANALNNIDSMYPINYSTQTLPVNQPLSPPYYHPPTNKPVPAIRSTEIPSTSHESPVPQVRRASSSITASRPSIDTFNNSNGSPEIHVESPKNMTIVQQAKFQPYKEVTKPFEMSDFYKYSTKFRQKNASVMSSPTYEPNSPKLPPKNHTNRTAPTPTIYSMHNQ